MNQNLIGVTAFAVLLSSLNASAWDDDDDTDYGYKNPYQSKIQHQESRITPTSTIDFGGPKRLAQTDDDNDHGYKNSYQSNIKNPRESVSRECGEKSIIYPTSPQQAYEDNDSKPFSQSRIQHQESKITLNTIQESVALRDRESREMMAESQRSFERQEAQQEKSRAQMAKQQEIYNKMDREEGEMAEFLGGVYKAKFGATTGHNSAITSDGYVFRSGNNFITPKGIYTKTGNTYAGLGSFTTQTGTLFFGNESTTIQAGGAYFSEGKSGFIVSPNTSTWRTR